MSAGVVRLNLGDVLTTDLPGHVPHGREQEGFRPAVVVGLPTLAGPTRFPMVLVAPVTLIGGSHGPYGTPHSTLRSPLVPVGCLLPALSCWIKFGRLIRLACVSEKGLSRPMSLVWFKEDCGIYCRFRLDSRPRARFHEGGEPLFEWCVRVVKLLARHQPTSYQSRNWGN
ncbi:hypothetical protein D3C72_425550 [compost metagenome]